MDTPASCSINPFNGHSHCTGPGECLRPCITYALTLSFLIIQNHAASRFSYSLCLEFRYINLNLRGMNQFAGFDQPQESSYANNYLYGNGGSLPLTPSLPLSLPPSRSPTLFPPTFLPQCAFFRVACAYLYSHTLSHNLGIIVFCKTSACGGCLFLFLCFHITRDKPCENNIASSASKHLLTTPPPPRDAAGPKAVAAQY